MATANATCPPCALPMKATSNGAFQGDNPLDYSLPLAILQICIVVVLTRTLAFLLRPLRQPRVIAEVIGGILLGPSAIGRSKAFLDNVFPKQSMMVLDTFANIGLLFFLFLVGLELDIKSVRRTGSRALAIAVAGISVPFIFGIGISVVLRRTIAEGARNAPFLVFMGVALSITAFPVLARILAELKLLTTDIGRMAMSAAAVNDVAAWILLALAIALSGSGSPLISLWVFLSGVAFVLFAAVAIRFVLSWMTRRTPEGVPAREIYVCITLVSVLAAGFITDAIGIHALFGAFIMGIVMPKEGPFAGFLIEKIDDFISILFLPLYFVSSGLKTDISTISGGVSWALLALVIATACLGKIGGTIVASMAMKIPFREALTLGFLMNTKGLVELIVLNIGRDRKVLNDETFAIMVLMALVTTFITTPFVMGIYKPARKAAPYKHRKIERPDTDSELRVLACYHGNSIIPTLINLIESSRGNRRQGVAVYTLRLLEFTESSSSISTVHKARRNGLPFWNKKRENGDYFGVAFQAYQQLSHVTIREMIAISDLNSIHLDVITSAQQKRAAMILLPFHKSPQLDGSMEPSGNGYQHVNQRVLLHAPCTVAILIDRGLGGYTHVSASEVSYSVVVIFFGGSDDREALIYGLRMAEHPGIFLTVLRFLSHPDGSHSLISNADNFGILMDADQQSDDVKCISRLREMAAANDDGSVRYEEKMAGNKEEIVSLIKEVERCNLFLVGQRSPVMPLAARTDCPELGPVGSYLGSSHSTSASVLVIKQYDPSAMTTPLVEEVPEDAIVPDTPSPTGRN